MDETGVVVRLGRVGWGVFAARPFPRQAVIAVVSGQRIEDANHTSDYAMELSEYCSLEPNPPFRYVNHACEPNCELVVFEDSELGPGEVMTICAIQDIQLEEELTIDYAWPAHHAIRCQCLSDACRGWIVDEAELHQLAPDLDPPAA